MFHYNNNKNLLFFLGILAYLVQCLELLALIINYKFRKIVLGRWEIDT